MRQIAIYGKGGIGKSTIATNIAASLGESNKVLQIGCDPKSDSTRRLLGGRKINTLLEIARSKNEESIRREEFVHKGFNNVSCIEAGGPEPGIGCAGRGIILAIDIMRKKGVFDEDWDYIIYDVLGDVVCGGFAVPIREGFANEIYLVVSGEFMSLYAANNICKAIARYGNRGKSRLAGIIGNQRGINDERMITEFARKIGSGMIGLIPRSEKILDAELHERTVIEKYPGSGIAGKFRDLAAKIEANRSSTIPRPLEDDELDSLKAAFRSA